MMQAMRLSYLLAILDGAYEFNPTILDESYESKSLGVEKTVLSRNTGVVIEPLIRFLEESRH